MTSPIGPRRKTSHEHRSPAPVDPRAAPPGADDSRLRFGDASSRRKRDEPVPASLLLEHGTSPAVVALRARLHAIAGCGPMRALIGGPPGSEKLAVARWLHVACGVPGACVTIPCALGLDPAAADRFPGFRRDGEPPVRADQCTHGTWVLDDVSRLPLHLQRLVVREIESGHLEGADSGDAPDRGLVAVLREPLRDAFCEGRLHRDLYRALSDREVRVPGLDEAASDVPALVHAILRRLDGETGRRCAPTDPGLFGAFTAASWGGSLAQLEAVLRAAHGRCRSGTPVGPRG